MDTATARFDAATLSAERREQVMEWIASLGIDPADVRPCGVIVCGDLSYELHLSRFVRDEDGRKVIDHAANDCVSVPMIVDLGQRKSWPGWLGVAEIVRPGRLSPYLASPVNQREPVTT